MRPTIIIAAFLTLGIAGSVAAQPFCPGDSNISNNVTVDEIVASVNAALDGCPEPVGCPLRFDEPDALVDCVFVGRWHPICGTSDYEALLYTAGDQIVVSLFDPDIDFVAEVQSAEVASLLTWEEIESGRGPVPVEGEVLLSQPPRVALTVFPFEIPFSIDECNFERYEGRFAETLDFFSLSTRASHCARLTSRIAASRERLEAMRREGRFVAIKAEAPSQRRSRDGSGSKIAGDGNIPNLAPSEAR